MLSGPKYQSVLQEIKASIEEAKHRSVMAVNSRMLFLYWQIGDKILKQQRVEGWGTKVIDQLSIDLRMSFPEMTGFSKRNLEYMQKFASEWPTSLFQEVVQWKGNKIPQQGLAELKSQRKVDGNELDRQGESVEESPGQADASIPQQGLAETGVALGPQESSGYILSFDAFEKLPISRIPWSHHLVLLSKFESPEIRLFYCKKIIENSWSRKVLLNQLDRGLHEMHGALTHNFSKTLPAAQSELARDTFKDPYIFDFLHLGEELKEKEIEDRLIGQITRFLLELGAGFAYMGRQYRLEVGGQEYFLDLLFYHTKLRCYIMIELKIGEFKPEHVGKVQFYLAALDDLVKTELDGPSIGLILVKEANRVVAEYALRESNKPIGIARYKGMDELPDKFRKALPGTDEIEKHLN